MQQLQTASNGAAAGRTADRRRESDADRAVRLMDLVPRMMCELRQQVRAERGDLTMPQYRILARLARGPHTASELAEHMGVSPSALSHMLATLARKGVLVRTADPADRRRVTVRLTPRGTGRFEALRRATGRKLLERIRRIPAERQRILADGLAVLRELLP